MTTIPLVYVFRARVQEGKLDAFRQFAREHAAFAEQTHPHILAFHQYLSDDGREVSAVQIHPNADSMDVWMKDVVSSHGVTAYEFLERGTERSLAFGAMNPATLDQILQFGVEVDLNPEHLAGFTRRLVAT